jgi:aspartate racemase
VSDVLGILGGMGPLASAEFLKTIYDQAVGDARVEQDLPACVLYSDPTFPDRTNALMSGADDLLVRRLVQALEDLHRLDVGHVVICCVTIHGLLPRAPAHLRDRVISLVDVIVEEVIQTGEVHLLLCTTGTRHAGVFQRHERWDAVKRYIAFLDDDEQRAVHNFIYAIKRGDGEMALRAFDEFLRNHPMDRFIAGCTEIHLLTKYRLSRESEPDDYQLIDPLLIIARRLKEV